MICDQGGIEVAQLIDELIICTRNRPDDVARCLDSVAAQVRMPRVVRIVDSSDGPATEGVVTTYTTKRLAGVLVYQRCRPGLTAQRNAGLDASQAEIVHFIDDDVVLEPDYVASILAFFAADRSGDVLGVGGLVTNVHHEPAARAKRIFGLYGNEPGVVLPSGRNVLAVDFTMDRDVEWLSGCSMSYRRKAFEGRRFDEGLPGYGLGEDVDLSYRVSQFGRLVVTPSARLVHLQSGTNRLTSVQYTRDELITRARRVRRGTGRMRMRRYWWSVGGQVAALAVASISGPHHRLCRDRLSVTIHTAKAIALEGLSRQPRLEPTTLTTNADP